jgi:hypothetical protein
MVLPVFRGPFTVEAYQRLAQVGILREEARVELIGGQVVEMTPLGDRHAACVRRLARRLFHDLHDRAIVDVQHPVWLDEYDLPQPDLVVLQPRPDLYPNHPRAAAVLLIIEVADTTLTYDRNVKLPLYARSGIPEAWLVDLQADQIQVYREPGGEQYVQVRLVSRGDTVTALCAPDLRLSANEILG